MALSGTFPDCGAGFVRQRPRRVTGQNDQAFRSEVLGPARMPPAASAPGTTPLEFQHGCSSLLGRDSLRQAKRHDNYMRTFNTEGPVVPADHYNIPPLDRMDMDYLLELNPGQEVLHPSRAAPNWQNLRPTGVAGPAQQRFGGTLSLRLRQFGGAQAAREDVGEAMRSILHEFASRARSTLRDEFMRRIWPESLERAGPFRRTEGCLDRVVRGRRPAPRAVG